VQFESEELLGWAPLRILIQESARTGYRSLPSATVGHAELGNVVLAVRAEQRDESLGAYSSG